MCIINDNGKLIFTKEGKIAKSENCVLPYLKPFLTKY